MENNKYYTPEIEEFHVGFEYEVFIPEKQTWSKEVFYLTNSHINLIKFVTIQNEHTHNKIRVKYLDQKDIESLGFVLYGKGNKTFHIKTNTSYIIHLLDKVVITKNIKLPDNTEATVTIFEGKIKNKSELIKLLKQLRIYGN